MCKSVRGAAYFGSSIHLALSFVFLFWFVFDTLIAEININLWKCDPPEVKFRDIDPLAHYLNVVFKLFYFIALFVTGIYCFRGVERERPEILKFATLGFVILQIIGIVLFSIFYSIQWNAEPNSTPSPINARLASEPSDDSLSTGVIPESPINVLEGSMESGDVKEGVLPAPPLPESIPDVTNTVTPMVSENVLPAPDINDTTTTTTPVPPPPPAVDKDVTTTTASAATTTTATTDLKSRSPCSAADCPTSAKPDARQRLPHNLLVSLVFQMCLAIVNGIGSVVYVIVLALYMLKL